MSPTSSWWPRRLGALALALALAGCGGTSAGAPDGGATGDAAAGCAPESSAAPGCGSSSYFCDDRGCYACDATGCVAITDVTTGG